MDNNNLHYNQAGRSVNMDISRHKTYILFETLYWKLKRFEESEEDCPHPKTFCDKIIWATWENNAVVRQTTIFGAELRALTVRRSRAVRNCRSQLLWTIKVENSTFLNNFSDFDLFDLNNIFLDMNRPEDVENLRKETKRWGNAELFVRRAAYGKTELFCCKRESRTLRNIQEGCGRCFSCKHLGEDSLFTPTF